MSHRIRLFVCASLVALLAAVPSVSFARRPSAFTNQSRPTHARVTMLAVSSSSRQSFAGNREVYLADLQIKGGDRQFVRVIDQYPGFGLPIRESLLRNGTLLSVTVTREPDCDVPGAEIFLAPSDRVIFNASVRDALRTHQTDLIPCYKTLHNTIQVAKQ